MKFNITKQLEPLDIRLQDILLDPNNPRFAEIDSTEGKINESRYDEERIKENTYRKMKQNFDVDVLANTIKELGFLPLDKIIVRKWNFADNKYVVIEGNRRIAALKSILEQHANGTLDLTQEQIDNYTKLNVLLLKDSNETSLLNILIPGLRHVSGIKDWGPYQKAKLLCTLRDEEKLAPQQAAESIGLSVQKANNLYRSYKAFMQMCEDEEYGESINARMFSFAEETIKKKSLKDWLGWDDKNKEITNKENLTTLLSLFISNDDDSEPKITSAIQIRDFAKIIETNDSKIINFFLSQGGTLMSTLAKIDVSNTKIQWKDRILDCIEVLGDLSQDTLLNMQKDDLTALETLKDKIDKTIETIQKLS